MQVSNRPQWKFNFKLSEEGDSLHSDQSSHCTSKDVRGLSFAESNAQEKKSTTSETGSITGEEEDDEGSCFEGIVSHGTLSQADDDHGSRHAGFEDEEDDEDFEEKIRWLFIERDEEER